MESDVDEVCRDVFQQRPSMRRVGHHQPDALAPQQGDECRVHEAGMAHFDGMPQGACRRLDQPGSGAGDAIVVRLCQLERGSGVTGQPADEILETLGVECQLRRQLPKHRPELAPQCQHARGEEVRERRARVAQLLHVGDETRPLHGENEVRRRLVMPLLPCGRPLQRIERAVDLDRPDVA